MPILGAHVSIAGGVHNSIARALEIGCDTFQIFTKNQRQWVAPPIGEYEAAEFKIQLSGSGLGPILSHDSYLINLAASDPSNFERSVDSFFDELARCSVLGIPYLVAHPGSHLGTGDRIGSKRVIEGLDISFSRLERSGAGTIPEVLLETTAGQGTSLGSSFENIEVIRAGSSFSESISVCFDTCHVFASGYDISTEEGYNTTMEEFDEILGLDLLKAFHLNDSLKGAGSRVDRHTNIGEGEIGPGCFSYLMRDDRFKNIPMILETPGGDEGYLKDLSLLRSLSLG